MLTEQPNTLESLKERFRIWRATKQKGDKIPDSLWQFIPGLIGDYKKSVLISQLGISTGQFKKKFPHLYSKYSQPKKGKAISSTNVSSPFVEIPYSIQAQPTMIIEYPSGIKISLFSIPPEQWSSLSQAWRNE